MAIYFVQANGPTGPVKIGYATSPQRRASKIASDNHSSCKLLGWVEGSKKEEALIHESLNAARISGEWFRWQSVEGLLHKLVLKEPPPARRYVKTNGRWNKMPDDLRAGTPEYYRQWRAKNREHYKQWLTKYRRKNRAKIREYDRNYRRKRRAASKKNGNSAAP